MAKKEVYEKALRECLNGKVCPELKELYNYPLRSEIPWSLFPDWARPDVNCEMPHEG